MATRANITSVDAIEAFRSALIIYLSKAGPALEEITAEVVRTRMWVQDTQRTHWEGIRKRRARTLEEAKAAVFSARLSHLRDVSSGEQLALTKAKRSLDEAEEKMRVLKRWGRDFDNKVEPLTRKLEKMHSILHEEMTDAVAHLSQIVRTLDAYAGIMAPSLGEASPPPTAVSDEATPAEPVASPPTKEEKL